MKCQNLPPKTWFSDLPAKTCKATVAPEAAPSPVPARCSCCPPCRFRPCAGIYEGHPPPWREMVEENKQKKIKKTRFAREKDWIGFTGSCFFDVWDPWSALIRREELGITIPTGFSPVAWQDGNHQQVDRCHLPCRGRNAGVVTCYLGIPKTPRLVMIWVRIWPFFECFFFLLIFFQSFDLWLGRLADPCFMVLLGHQQWLGPNQPSATISLASTVTACQFAPNGAWAKSRSQRRSGRKSMMYITTKWTEMNKRHQLSNKF